MAMGGIQQSTKKGTMETGMPLLLVAAVVVAAATTAAAWLQHGNGGSGSEAPAARAAQR